MCLYSKTNKSLVAAEDITCYKLLWKLRNSQSQNHYTAYVDSYVNENIIKGDEDLVASGIEHILHFKIRDCYEITNGFIHTFKSKEDAIDLAKGYYCESIENVDYEVYECIIPKGTRYYESVNDYDFCSKKIRFVKQTYTTNDD